MRLMRLALLLCCVLLASCQSTKVPDDKLAGQHRVALLIRSPDTVHFVRDASIFAEESSAARLVAHDNGFVRDAIERAVIKELSARRPDWRVTAVRSIGAPIRVDLSATVVPWARSVDPTMVLAVSALPIRVPYADAPQVGEGYGLYGVVGSIGGPFVAPYICLGSSMIDPRTGERLSIGAFDWEIPWDRENHDQWLAYLPNFEPGGPLPDLAYWGAAMERLVPIIVAHILDDHGI